MISVNKFIEKFNYLIYAVFLLLPSMKMTKVHKKNKCKEINLKHMFLVKWLKIVVAQHIKYRPKGK